MQVLGAAQIWPLEQEGEHTAVQDKVDQKMMKPLVTFYGQNSVAFHVVEINILSHLSGLIKGNGGPVWEEVEP